MNTLEAKQMVEAAQFRIYLSEMKEDLIDKLQMDIENPQFIARTMLNMDQEKGSVTDVMHRFMPAWEVDLLRTHFPDIATDINRGAKSLIFSIIKSIKQLEEKIDNLDYKEIYNMLEKP